mmetsp:Transcript_20908/g.58203  ORF Transcript_20908/g.58203 Transcript_20908/m.58203 type:complete len:204 (+) Transcript_20908:278-889(+)
MEAAAASGRAGNCGGDGAVNGDGGAKAAVGEAVDAGWLPLLSSSRASTKLRSAPSAGYSCTERSPPPSRALPLPAATTLATPAAGPSFPSSSSSSSTISPSPSPSPAAALAALLPPASPNTAAHTAASAHVAALPEPPDTPAAVAAAAAASNARMPFFTSPAAACTTSKSPPSECADPMPLATATSPLKLCSTSVHAGAQPCA